MVTIPPTKMVMTGGWFIIVLPTLVTTNHTSHWAILVLTHIETHDFEIHPF
jgi:hypothetical protein